MKTIKLFALALIASLAVTAVSCDKSDNQTSGTEQGGGDDSGNGGSQTTDGFTIAVSDITSESAFVTVTPSNATKGYYFDILEAEYLEYFEAGELFDLMLELVDEELADYGYTIEDMLSTGKDAYEFEDLDSDTEYVVMSAYVVSGKRTSEVTVKTFTTLAGSGDSGSDDESYYSNLTDDLTMSDIVYASIDDYGNYYGSGTRNWYLYLENEEGNAIVSDFFTAQNATSPVGEYTIDLSDADSVCEPGTALFGGIDEDGYSYGTWYMSDEYLTVYAAADYGIIEIAQSGGNYTVSVLFEDENGYTVSADYTGEVEFSDESADYPFSTRAKIARAQTRKYLHKFSNAPEMRATAKVLRAKKQPVLSGKIKNLR